MLKFRRMNTITEARKKNVSPLIFDMLRQTTVERFVKSGKDMTKKGFIDSVLTIIKWQLEKMVKEEKGE